MIEAIEQFFLAYPMIGYVLTFFGSFGESVAFLGVFIPGTVIAILGGFMAEQWPRSFAPLGIFLLLVLGAFLGNVSTYLLGRYYGPPLFSEKNFYLKRQYLKRAQEYFAAHGGVSLFTGQFLGPLRSLVPLVAGMASMPLWRFLSWTLAASLAWSSAYFGIGYFFGASWEAVELWGTRLSIFMVILAALFVLNWVLGRFLVRHERQVRAIVFSITRSIVQGFLGNEYVAALINRYPKFFGFLRNRLSLQHRFGFSFTLPVVVSFILLFYLLVLIHAIVAKGPLLILDQRILGAVTFMRDPLLNPIMQTVTNLAGTPAAALIAVVGLFLWLEGRRLRAAVLVAGTGLAVFIEQVLKQIFFRARPDEALALITEPSPSFPSGHAVVAVVFYGFTLFVMLRYVRRWRVKIFLALATSMLILLIGFSRVYLGVHWPSDVLGGYLFGAWWLTVMLAFTYVGERSFAPPAPAPLRAPAMVMVGLVATAAAGILLAYGAARPLRVVQHESVLILPRIEAPMFRIGLLNDLPKRTETFTGRTQVPINLVFVGTRQEVVDVFTKAGWDIADPISVQNIWKTVRASLDNKPYPTAPFSPGFYDGRVQDMGFQQSTAAQSARERHHLRLWLAPVALKDGNAVWVGSASFDEGVSYSPVLKIPTHIISPNIDQERDYVRQSLLGTGLVRRVETVSLIEPILGQSTAGSPFFTNGQAHVFWLR